MAQFAVIAAVAASVLQSQQTKAAGTIKQEEGETAARLEELGAVQREKDRKARLSSALASQVAESGAKGIAAFEGSPLTILEEDIRREEEATERDIFQSRFSSLTKRARGNIAERQLTTQANVGLLSDVGKAAKVAKFGPEK